MKVLTYIVAFCLAVFIEVLIGTWLWGLIAVAIFGLPALTPLQFLGLMYLVHIIIPHYNIKKEDD
jgi:hypothetical protein